MVGRFVFLPLSPVGQPHRKAFPMTMPKLTVRDYPEMLRKLSAAAFVVSAGCISILRASIPCLDGALEALEDSLTPEILILRNLTIPFGTFVLAFLIAAISEAIRLHDKISDLFQIRHDFDVRWILIPIALQSAAPLSHAQYERIKSSRSALMTPAFYRWASSSPAKCQIDPHVVVQAMTVWSWYWVCVESIVLVLLTAAILFISENYQLAAITLFFVLVLQALMRILRVDCNRYAESEVRQILDDAARKTQNAALFNAL